MIILVLPNNNVMALGFVTPCTKMGPVDMQHALK